VVAEIVKWPEKEECEGIIIEERESRDEAGDPTYFP
jgi:hypothetical protein